MLRRLLSAALLAIFLSVASVPVMSGFQVMSAQAGIVSKVAKFAAARLLVSAIRASTPALRTIARNKLLDMVKRDPLLLEHVTEIAGKVAQRYPTVRTAVSNLMDDVVQAARFDRRIEIPRSRYPEYVEHMIDAVEDGLPRGLEINRAGTRANRRLSIGGQETSPNFDLDEYPPAMFREGGEGASVRPMDIFNNRGAGSCLGHQCRGLEDGARVLLDWID